jgi:hypothetical protein
MVTKAIEIKSSSKIVENGRFMVQGFLEDSIQSCKKTI